MATDSRKAEFLRLAGEAYERMVRDEPEQMITFDQIEERALAVGSTLECWLLEHCAALSAERSAQSRAECPTCHKPLKMAPPEKRRIMARTGEVTIQRAIGYCASCRRSFSPSGRILAVGLGRL